MSVYFVITKHLVLLIKKNSFNQLYFKFKDEYNGPFDAFEKYNIDECQMFINWLELYSFSVEQTIQYNSSIFNNNINENLKILAGINDFKILKSILEKCEWVNNNINEQALNSIFLK